MSDFQLDPRLNIDLDMGAAPAVYSWLALREQLLHRRTVAWATRSVRPLGPSVASSRRPTAVTEVFRFGDALIHLQFMGGELTAMIAAAARSELDDLERLLRREFPAIERDGAQEVPVSFWTRGSDGAQRVIRRIAVPAWPEIADGYGPAAARAMSTAVAARDGLAGGQLMLWHGPPGTGKTYALRALAWEWRSWCDLHYVVDPDKLLGDRPDYLVELLLRDDDDGCGIEDFGVDDHGMEGVSDDGGGDGDSGRRARWRLLVLEDCGELVSADARAQAGQGLSRLLNTVDGLIGQGLRVLVLITTNEEVGRLHPALSRPGRCAAVVEFPCLTREHAARWLAERGHSNEGVEASPLAELYAVLAGREARRTVRPTGFAVAFPQTESR